MSFGLVYWIIMLIWLLFGLWSSWPVGPANGRMVGGHLILFILLVLLGYKVFGPPIHQ